MSSETTEGEKIAQGIADLLAASLVAERRGGAEALQMIDIAVGRLGNAIESYSDELADEVAERLLLVQPSDPDDGRLYATGATWVRYWCGHEAALANGDEILASCRKCAEKEQRGSTVTDAGQPWLRTYDEHEKPGPDGVLTAQGSQFITGVGQKLHNVHRRVACAGRPCVIHAPSDHPMRSFPTNWRTAGPLDIKPSHMERICPHGIGHPDPDDSAYHGPGVIDVHGCDGCCSPPEQGFRKFSDLREEAGDEFEGYRLHAVEEPGSVRTEAQIKADGLPPAGAYITDSTDLDWTVDYEDSGDTIALYRQDGLGSGKPLRYPRGLFLELWRLGAYSPYDTFGR